MSLRRRFGPGFLVAAAFIGPGTVTTASLAGARYGFALAWTLAAAVVATLVLQEMSARVGVVARRGLGEALRDSLRVRPVRLAAVVLGLTAITFGNAAYQAGNLTGASLGLEALVGGPRPAWVLACAVAAAALLWTGAYRVVETALIGLVALMSVVFVATAVQVGPALFESLSARPALPAGAGFVALALVGTTVVPYNLFLHAAAVKEKWPDAAALSLARRDTVVAVLVGGVVTLAILVTAVPLFIASVSVGSADDLARQLEPLLGTHARWLFAAGLFAAGLTSAVTAPLAAAWATAGLLGWDASLRSRRFRLVWGAIIVVGAAFAATGTRPLEAILVAQAANGLLLPLIAAFLLWTVNSRAVMGDARNGWVSNVAGGAVVLLSLLLGGSQLARLFG